MSLDNFSTRLGQLIENKGFKNANEFGKALGYSSSEKISRLIRNPENRPSFEILQDIANKFDDVSLDWLVSGQHSVSKPSKNKHLAVNEEAEPYLAASRIIEVVGRENNPLHLMVPVKAQAGYLDNYENQEWFSELPTCQLPGLQDRSLWLWEVEGNSMNTDTGGLNSGDWVVAERIYGKSDIRDGRVYVLVHKDGVLIKRILNRVDKDGKLIAKSDNLSGNYPPIVVEPSDVLELWYVVGYFSRQLPPPSNLYQRINDLEGRLILMEQGK